MRSLTDHIVNPVNDSIAVTVLDEPGQGGANHLYQMAYTTKDGDRQLDHIKFQNGPITVFGVNGITQEILLTIVIDRLRCFQAGPFACPENADALAHATEALEALKSRTRERMQRGVEGRHVK